MRGWLPILLATSACGDSVDPVIRGEHRSYVMSYQHVPASGMEAREIGIDVNGDGVVDNQAGTVLSTLARSNFIQPQIRTDRAIDRGLLIQLLDLQVPDSGDHGAAVGFALEVGRDPLPSACADATDTICRRHLDGTGVFAVDAFSAFPPLKTVSDDDGYTSRSGRLSLLLGAFGTPTPLDLVAARVEIDELTDELVRGRIGGGITLDDLYGRLMPGYHEIVATDIEHDCVALDTPPACGCRVESAGSFYIGAMDTSPKDCTVSYEELIENPLVESLLSPDIVIRGQQLLSVGIGFEAVPAAIE